MSPIVAMRESAKFQIITLLIVPCSVALLKLNMADLTKEWLKWSFVDDTYRSDDPMPDTTPIRG
jgi:hypothetical protein